MSIEEINEAVEHICCEVEEKHRIIDEYVFSHCDGFILQDELVELVSAAMEQDLYQTKRDELAKYCESFTEKLKSSGFSERTARKLAYVSPDVRYVSEP